jgi:mRNA interferase RelE/StbE
MRNYTVVLSKKAEKQLDNLSDFIAEPIIDAITGLEKEPRQKGYKKLKGRDGYRIRAGNYRIIYDIIDDVLLINVISIGHRKDIYE